ncbi:MAG: DUF4870 domain-containing protein [Sedimentisphaerales bacterium]|nr:DUF4870 domain-containing protein [Sedimentisphaerales bacterium]
MTEKDKVPSYQVPAGQAGAYAQEPAPGGTEDLPPIETSHEARNMAMLCHILGAVGFFAPLVIWLSEKDKHRFVADHGQEAMNYQISLMIYLAALAVTVIGAVLIPVLVIVHIVLIVLGAVKASRGEHWQYPIAIRFLK